MGRIIELPGSRRVGTLTVIGVSGDARDAAMAAPAAPLLYLPSLRAAALTGLRADSPT